MKCSLQLLTWSKPQWGSFRFAFDRSPFFRSIKDTSEFADICIEGIAALATSRTLLFRDHAIGD